LLVFWWWLFNEKQEVITSAIALFLAGHFAVVTNYLADPF
jgi:hypothetical protein